MSGTSDNPHRTALRRPLIWLQLFFRSWRFPIFMLVLVACYEALLAALLLLPAGDSEMAAFAEEFRTWCFGYDPATGKMQWAYVLTTFTSPLMLAAVLVLTWGHQMRTVLRRAPMATMPYALAALLVTITSAALMGTLDRADAEARTTELPFPADSLRTEFMAPDFTLINQNEETVTLSKLRGRVVLLTAVYSTCGFT